MAERFAGVLPTDVYGIILDETRVGKLSLTAAEAASAGAVRAAITGSATVTVTKTDAITNPPYPRNLVITPGGTTADVKAASITVTGTNIKDQVITEDFAFLANATDPTVGVKAFKTVTSISVPAQDGAGATFATSFGDKLGLPVYYDTADMKLLATYHDNTLESTAATITADADEIEKNVIDLNTTLNGKKVDIYFLL